MTHDTVVDGGGPRASHLALGILCGAVTGALLGLLFAPRTGVATRRQIADSTRRARLRAADAYTHARQAVNGAVTGSRRAIEAGAQAYKDARRANRPERPAGVAIS